MTRVVFRLLILSFLVFGLADIMAHMHSRFFPHLRTHDISATTLETDSFHYGQEASVANGVDTMNENIGTFVYTQTKEVSIPAPPKGPTSYQQAIDIADSIDIILLAALALSTCCGVSLI